MTIYKEKINKMGKVNKSKIKLITLFIWFLDILAIGIFIPIMPELALYYNVSAVEISYSIALYALFSFFSWPILWQLSDKYGRKIILLLCIIWTFISTLMMTLSSLFIVFLISRILNWLTWWNISILQSILSDISKDKAERIKNMWFIWMLFWLGFIVWPIIWSLLIPLWVKAPFWLMVGLAFIEIFVILFFLTETNNNKNNTSKINKNPLSSIFRYLKTRDINLFIISFFILMAASSTYQWMFPMFLNKAYNISSEHIWYIMASMWFLVALNQWFLLKKFWLKNFELKHLFIIINIWLFVLFLFLAFINILPLFLLVFYIMILFSWVVNPIYSAEIVESTWENSRWEIMWVLSSLSFITMFIWPILAWILIDKNISIFIWWAILVWINLLFLPKLYKLLK